MFRGERNLSQEQLRAENSMWRGDPIRLYASATLPADSKTSVRFVINKGNLPPNNNAETEVHVRSRYAHMGLDIELRGSDISEQARRVIEGNKPHLVIPVINHSQRPVHVTEDVLHLFSVPERALVRGSALELVVGNKPGKPIYIRGEEGRDYRIMYETSSKGESVATALYLRIDPNERFWMPPSNVPIELPKNITFSQMRELLFMYAFKRVNDPEYHMPRNGLWIGKGPSLKIHPNFYLKLDHFAFREKDEEFIKVGMQTHSPLLEGGRTDHVPHFEMKGNADWAKAIVIRNVVPAKAG